METIDENNLGQVIEQLSQKTLNEELIELASLLTEYRKYYQSIKHITKSYSNGYLMGKLNLISELENRVKSILERHSKEQGS